MNNITIIVAEQRRACEIQIREIDTQLSQLTLDRKCAEREFAKLQQLELLLSGSPSTEAGKAQFARLVQDVANGICPGSE